MKHYDDPKDDDLEEKEAEATTESGQGPPDEEDPD